VKTRNEPSLISSAGLIDTDLCVNFTALNIRGEGGRKSWLGGDQSSSRHLEHGKARQGCSRILEFGEKQGGCRHEGSTKKAAGMKGAASSPGES